MDHPDRDRSMYHKLQDLWMLTDPSKTKKSVQAEVIEFWSENKTDAEAIADKMKNLREMAAKRKITFEALLLKGGGYEKREQRKRRGIESVVQLDQSEDESDSSVEKSNELSAPESQSACHNEGPAMQSTKAQIRECSELINSLRNIEGLGMSLSPSQTKRLRSAEGELKAAKLKKQKLEKDSKRKKAARRRETVRRSVKGDIVAHGSNDGSPGTGSVCGKTAKETPGGNSKAEAYDV